MSNFIHHHLPGDTKNKQKTMYSEHRNTIGTLDNQAVTRVVYKINCK